MERMVNVANMIEFCDLIEERAKTAADARRMCEAAKETGADPCGIRNSGGNLYFK